jgi:hypothetical protein
VNECIVRLESSFRLMTSMSEVSVCGNIIAVEHQWCVRGPKSPMQQRRDANSTCMYAIERCPASTKKAEASMHSSCTYCISSMDEQLRRDSADSRPSERCHQAATKTDKSMLRSLVSSERLEPLVGPLVPFDRGVCESLELGRAELHAYAWTCKEEFLCAVS